MLKPATGLPVFAISWTMRSVHFGSIPMTMAAAQFGLRPCPASVRNVRSRSAPNCSRPYGCGRAIVPLMLWATASAAALDRSSTGMMRT